MDSINDIFRTMFPDHNIALMMMAPSKDSLNFPTEKEFVSAYRKAYEAPVTPYEEKLDEGGFRPRTAGGNRRFEQTDPVFGTTVWTLSNGARRIQADRFQERRNPIQRSASEELPPTETAIRCT